MANSIKDIENILHEKDSLMEDSNSLFKDEEFPTDDARITEDIDIGAIEDEAKEISLNMCDNLRKVYFDEDFMSNNPTLKKRLNEEVESLRVLIKMRKSSERAHDLCLRAIGSNGNNASMYAALAKVQSSMLKIQQQMDETVKNINILLKSIQLEINFNQEPQHTENSSQIENTVGTSRGSKSFIEQMKKELNTEE